MKKFHFPLYWLILMILTFVVLSLVPMLLGSFLSFLAGGADGHQMFHHFFPSLMFLASSLIISILISLALWTKVLIPLGNISQAAKQVAKGDFSVRAKPSRSLQELNELTSNFNRMVQELGGMEAFQSDFVTNISHEFKTPLAAIEGYAMLLQDPSLSEERRLEYTKIILNSTHQLSHMAGNILLLSRLERQEIVTEQTLFQLDEQIRQAILLLEPLWEKKHLELDIILSPLPYYGNSELLLQVWINLIQNAIKFTPPGGLVSVTMQTVPNAVRICVKDSGTGMTEEVKSRIFDKFYSQNTTSAQKGNGLGLSITKRIIILIHGSISVESTPGEGSCFTVQLPVESVDGTTKSSPVHLPSSSK